MGNTMFCPHCGNQIADNAAFCSACGNSLIQNQSSSPEQYTQTSVSDYSTNDTPFTDGNFAEVSFDNSAVAVKKKSRKPLIISAIAIALAVIIAIPVIIISRKKDNGGSEMMSAFSDAVKALNSNSASMTDKTKAWSRLYSSFVKDESNDTITMKLNASEDIINMLETALTMSTGETTDLSWITDTQIVFSAKRKDEVAQFGGSVDIEGETLLDIDAILDFESRDMFVGIPSLSNTYLSQSLSELISESTGSYTDDTTVDYIFSLYNTLLFNKSEFMPTESELNELIERYVSIMEKTFQSDNNNSTTLSVSGISQEVTMYSADIYEADIYTMCMEIINTAKDDETIKNIIERFVTYFTSNYEEMGVFDGLDAAEILYEYETALEEAAWELEESIAEADSSNYITITRYVDSDDTIVGRKLNSSGEEIFYYATASDGSNYAFTLDINENNIIYGNGTISDGKKTGTYTVFEYGQKELFEYSIKDFSFGESGPNGSFIIYPPEDALEEIPGYSDLSSFISGKIGIELKFASSGSSYGLDINLVAGSQTIIGLSLSVDSLPASSITIPSDTVSASQSDEWLDTVDIDAFLSKIQNSPLGDLIGDELSDMLSNDFSLDDSFDDYDYYDYYDYYDDYDW